MNKSTVLNRYLPALLFFLLTNLVVVSAQNTSCDSWIRIPQLGAAGRFGDLDIIGNKVTVEAKFIRLSPYNGTYVFAGDIVSKHYDPTDVNYLLRPGSAEITTTNGYYITPPVCDFELNKTYHVAMVYDGVTLKFYRNGFLMSQVACSGNLINNDYPTTIGQNARNLFINPQEWLDGYLDDVRIWNVARTQAEIRTYINNPLPDPTTQPGLQAYYRLNSLTNLQGNPAWNGSLVNGATIGQTNPFCQYRIDSCAVLTSNYAQAAFSVPDTVCVGQGIVAANASVNAYTNSWSFCSASLQAIPAGGSLGNPGNALQSPSGIEIIRVNENYYGFVLNGVGGGVVRLDYGNSLMNAPVSVVLQNTMGAIPATEGGQALRVVNNNGDWYLIALGGSQLSGYSPRLVAINLGPDITNTSPSVINWGNIGNMVTPKDLYLFEEGSNWYGLVVDAGQNALYRFNFTNSFVNAPTAILMGNAGGMQYPTHIAVAYDNNSWVAFVTNAGTINGTTASASLTRLVFGNSLLNSPIGAALGNPGNLLAFPTAIAVLSDCNEAIAYVTNGVTGNNMLIKLDFAGNLMNPPTATSWGNIPSLANPGDVSSPFQSGNDLFLFITGRNTNNITRFRFEGCTNASIATSAQDNPPSFSYDSPGTYYVNLVINDGLPTRRTACRRIVVNGWEMTLLQADSSRCVNANLALSANDPTLNSFLWSTGASSPQIVVNEAGKYWVSARTRFGCQVSDTVLFLPKNVYNTIVSVDTSFCEGNTIRIGFTGSEGLDFAWENGSTSPWLDVNSAGEYHLITTDANGCTLVHEYRANVDRIGDPNLGVDTTICEGQTIQLTSNATGTQYLWSNGATTRSIVTNNPGRYGIVVTSGTCQAEDDIELRVNPLPVFTLSADTTICSNEVITAGVNIPGATYKWSDGVTTGIRNIQVPGYHQLTVSLNGCSATKGFQVTQTGIPEITMIEDTIVCFQAVQIRPVISNGVFVNWNDGFANLNRELDQPGRYVLTAENRCGQISDTVNIHRGNLDPTLFKMPNAFTPNGDGANDCFGGKRFAGVSFYRLVVYNRWGQEVFVSSSPADCWDGTVNGNPQPPGGYAYIITASTACGVISQKGLVMLIR